MFHTHFVSGFLKYLHTKFHMPSLRGSLAIINIPKAKHRVYITAMLLFHILQKRSI
jgi:hypothetical protein